jgi:AcrR family transcriptional regulator
LDAAWQELVANGYGAFTMEAVAERAGTSRPVLYRRWKSRQELAEAAIRHDIESSTPPMPDTGSLREDLRVLLEFMHERRASLAVHFSGYFQETSTSASELRGALALPHTNVTEAVYERAIVRGELDPERLTQRVASLPFDLLRLESLMTLKPVPAATIDAILDEIFLPLVAVKRRWGRV